MAKPHTPVNVDPLLELRRACTAAGSQRRWAQAHGLSPQYVTEVLRGRREPGPALCDALSLQRIISYQKTRP